MLSLVCKPHTKVSITNRKQKISVKTTRTGCHIYKNNSILRSSQTNPQCDKNITVLTCIITCQSITNIRTYLLLSKTAVQRKRQDDMLFDTVL